uniref:Uncharacterized protein n=1 Tax=viral metagenome TaxID=1070528 RepID=A0A6C0EEF0_9ZZZZ
MDNLVENKIIDNKIIDNKIIDNNTCDNSGRYIYSIFHILMTIVAIYLSVRCNGISILNIIIAFICPYVYIIHSIIIYNGICENKSS